MEHKGTKTIETNRLLLRKFCAEDINAAYMNWTSDERVTEFLRWPTHTSMEITEKVIKDWIKESEKADFYQWAIVLKDINEPIGTISVVDKNDDLNILHIGYCIGSKWWHKGITSEAFSAIIPYLFNEVGAIKGVLKDADAQWVKVETVKKGTQLINRNMIRNITFDNK